MGREEGDRAQHHAGFGDSLASQSIVQLVVAGETIDRAAGAAEAAPAAHTALQVKTGLFVGFQDGQPFRDFITLSEDKDFDHFLLRHEFSTKSNTTISSEAARVKSWAIPSARCVCTR